mmetsp:Transcript_42934/g.50364  ORF Transcript_42934/g.50364 Transcript_42934/m.50364 type:complete len:181 (+) Transcript_42934:48-590(+)
MERIFDEDFSDEETVPSEFTPDEEKRLSPQIYTNRVQQSVLVLNKGHLIDSMKAQFVKEIEDCLSTKKSKKPDLQSFGQYANPVVKTGPNEVVEKQVKEKKKSKHRRSVNKSPDSKKSVPKKRKLHKSSRRIKYKKSTKPSSKTSVSRQIRSAGLCVMDTLKVPEFRRDYVPGATQASRS